jgi:hypothetical protein
VKGWGECGGCGPHGMGKIVPQQNPCLCSFVPQHVALRAESIVSIYFDSTPQLSIRSTQWAVGGTVGGLLAGQKAESALLNVHGGLL